MSRGKKKKKKKNLNHLAVFFLNAQKC